MPPSEYIGETGKLTGYGVTMDLKKMDYLALDDRRSATEMKINFPYHTCTHSITA